MLRRNLLILGTGLLAAPRVHAQAFPSAPMTLICAWPPGGGSDIAMRLVAEAASKKFGVPVVVDNRPGAAGAIGHRAIATARPDGYTFGMFSTAGVAAPYLNANANTIDELEPLAFFGSDPSALQASTASGIASLQDFVTRARANPGKIKNGNDQPGGASFLAVASYEKLMNFRIQKVPYAGYAPTVTALLAGEVDSATVAIPDTIEYHRQGKLKILGVSSAERHFMAPEIPTFKEQGFDVEVGSWRCIAGPKGMPEDRLRTLRSGLLDAMRDPDFLAKARQAGFTTQPGDAATTLARWRADDQLLYTILDEAGLVKARKR
ncbi:Bug family tripartite tricarboxylate transporter substrate binding protein [Siccirubricoccus phaeus]|uniref:Bug family tripartite tricarboxylate transporter substrate binding protein n=1 Tax=Siccirubricoccus phaeus TaxID=2595053 RepID=UPI0011F1651B|nr:tripartite tricarboxylate transporter substrate binding protein [Siccirubricoccus phaeus]